MLRSAHVTSKSLGQESVSICSEKEVTLPVYTCVYIWNIYIICIYILTGACGLSVCVFVCQNSVVNIVMLTFDMLPFYREALFVESLETSRTISQKTINVAQKSTGELPKGKRAEHPKNVFSYIFLEILFLGAALLVFLCSNCTRREKKKLEHSIF
jgi:hypothetical protein